MADKFFNRFLMWLIGSILFALLIHVLFKTPAPSEFFERVWSAGDILTYISTVILAWIAFWQNRCFKRESDNYQEKQNALTDEANRKFLILQDNISRQTNMMALLESEKMTPFFRIAVGLTRSGVGRTLTIEQNSKVSIEKFSSYNAHLKNIGVNGIADIVCSSFSIEEDQYQAKSTPETFGIDPGEVCFISLPYLYGESQTLILKFNVINVIGQSYAVEYKLTFKEGHCPVGEMISIKRVEQSINEV